MSETVALSRPKRSTAGNRMRELLEKAHQEDEDELFREVEDDEDFAAPQETRDVFLEDFADTDDEVEVDEEEVERQMRREERRKAKGKTKAIHNPLKQSKPKPTLLDPSIDPDTMAPSTLVLALRKQRRDEKRAGRSEQRRSNLRASTLKTEEDIAERERLMKENRRKGRKAQHEGGEIRGVRAMTQDELIAAALEQEERNKEELTNWLKREEERRELRRVGRKRVKGPRWTWVSRTVGKAVEDPSADAYARNYLILSQIPGGLPAEFSLILGDHTDWSNTQYIPARNRPLTRRPPTCPFTGLPAKYRHPATGVQYANVDGYKQIEALIRNEYVWSDAGWLGKEDEGEDMEGWMEAVSGGWQDGTQFLTVPDPDPVEAVVPIEPKRRKRKGWTENAG